MTSAGDQMREHPLEGGILRGVAELTPTERGWLPHRLPGAARAQCDDPQLLSVEVQPAGVRLAFRTRATAIELDLLRTRAVIVGVPDRPDGKVDLRIDGALAASVHTTAGDVMRVDLATGQSSLEPGPVGTVRFDDLPPHEKRVELWLPYFERVELVALRTDAPIAPMPVGERRVWLHHGSSISQGSNAASPSTTWTALAAASGDLDLVNLGFSGSAMLDPYTARAMGNTEADLLSVKIGINLVNADLMRQRAFGPAVHGFLDTIRDGHPDEPLLVLGPVHCPIHEDTPGPGAFDPVALQEGEVRFIATGNPAEVAGGRLSLSVIRSQLAAVVAARMAEDPNLHYIDGLELYGPGDSAAHPLPDNLHPDAATHELMAKRFAQLAYAAGGAFERR